MEITKVIAINMVNARANMSREELAKRAKTFVQNGFLAWPVGYDELNSDVGSKDLKDRIETLLEQKTEKALI